MADIVSPKKRSEMMARVRSKDTGPEMRVRRAAHASGLRFRLYRRDLPGTPDLVFPKYGVALFVHGCFWHRHEGCQKAYMPKSRVDFWQGKFAANVERDARAAEKLRAMAWTPVVIWECETTDPGRLAEILEERVRSLGAVGPDRETPGTA